MTTLPIIELTTKQLDILPDYTISQPIEFPIGAMWKVKFGEIVNVVVNFGDTGQMFTVRIRE